MNAKLEIFYANSMYTKTTTSYDMYKQSFL